MDIAVLPNNNHPEKFLQLDVGMLPVTHGMFQVGAAMSGQRHWHNRVYSQREHRGLDDHRAGLGDHRGGQGDHSGGQGERRSPPSPEDSPVKFTDRYLEQHITSVTFKPNIKRNPLYMDVRNADAGQTRKSPSWTIQEYDRHSVHNNLGNYMKEEEKTAKDLDFWLEDLYTPGYDSLLKKKEAELRQKKLCKVLSWIIVSVCVIIVIITVPIVVTKNNN